MTSLACLTRTERVLLVVTLALAVWMAPQVWAGLVCNLGQQGTCQSLQ